MIANNYPQLKNYDENLITKAVFEFNPPDRSGLIFRYRGTVVNTVKDETSLVAWQKSIYHFGSLTLTVPIIITLKTDVNGNISSIFIDNRSRGSQGKDCFFLTIQNCLNNRLFGKKLSRMAGIITSPADTDCLHIYEILSGSISFYNYLQDKGLRQGTEQEILDLESSKTGLTITDNHRIDYEESETVIVLNHNTNPVLNDNNLTCNLDCNAEIIFNINNKSDLLIYSDTFESTFIRLNRLFVKCCNSEKKYFGVEVPMKFSNYTALTGLTLIALSHESLPDNLTKALKIRRLLEYLQTGYGKHPCNGFKKK